MQITGHKNIQSINNFSSIDENQHRGIKHPLQPWLRNIQQNNSVANILAVRKTNTSNTGTSTVINVTGGIQNFQNGDVYG